MIIITSEWNEYLKFFKDEQKDIYFTEEYVKLYESESDIAECFIYSKGDDYFLFPYLKRRITIMDGDFYDFESQYGYGGPIVNTKNLSFIEDAKSEFFNFCYTNKLVCGFVRFHPLIRNYSLINIGNQVLFDRKTVAINLTLSEIDIWEKEIHSKNRNVIRKAINQGLEFKIDLECGNMSEFIKLYNQTMLKVNADDYYYFNNDYYKNLLINLRDKIFLGLIYSGNRIISAAIFFKYSIYGHYHLSGSDENFLNVSPNNLLLYYTSLYLKEQGCSHFHLGGGSSSSEENLLYKFKQRFSKNYYQFFIGKLIFNTEVYKEICNKWEQNNPEKIDSFKNILLKYRY